MIDILSILGLILGFGLVLFGYTVDGGILHILWLPSAFIIVLGGTVGATLFSLGAKQMKMFPPLVKECFFSKKTSLNDTIEYLVALSDKARKDGILSLEKFIATDITINGKKYTPDPFIRRAVLMIIDGTTPEDITNTLGNEIDIYEKEKSSGINIFDTMSTFAPAFGMIGTIMGLIMLLQDMSSVEQLTKSIAVAFVTTLYGSVMANLIFTPMSFKLRNKLSDYRLEKEMVIEAICSIRNSINPRLLRENLVMYMQFEPKKSNKQQPGKSTK